MTPNEQALGKEKLSSKQEETSNKKGSGNGSHLSGGFSETNACVSVDSKTVKT